MLSNRFFPARRAAGYEWGMKPLTVKKYVGLMTRYHWSYRRSVSESTRVEIRGKTDKMDVPAEVAQLVEQWSEELGTVSPREFPWKLAADTSFQPARTNSLAATSSCECGEQAALILHSIDSGTPAKITSRDRAALIKLSPSGWRPARNPCSGGDDNRSISRRTRAADSRSDDVDRP